MGNRLTDRCLQKVSFDEPIFVIRAQDRSAPRIVSDWINYNRATLSAEHRAESEKDLKEIIDWQTAHPDRVKNPD